MFDTFNLLREIRLFEILEMFYPPKGRLLTDSCGGPIVFNLGVIGVVKGVWGFKNTWDDRPFWLFDGMDRWILGLTEK